MKFLKPTKSKIIIFIILVLIVLIFLPVLAEIVAMCDIPPCPPDVGIILLAGIFLNPNMTTLLPISYGLIFAAIFLSYILACLVGTGIDKMFRKNTITPTNF